jgi:dolichyl-diphosphooligosaccharide--protein glycosyltransferase
MSRREKSSSPPRAAPAAAAPAAAAATPAAHPNYDLYTRLLPSCQLLAVLAALGQCVRIRLHAVATYGAVIHEFDPWFNYRATKYLVDHGWDAFRQWHDYESWYPLGRPVGTTVYPGLMVTAASAFHASERLDLGWSLNDICVYVPAAFAVVTCLCVYGIAYEVSRSRAAATLSCAMMAVMPAHLMRSVAGGFDNEAVAVPAIALVFYLWLRAIKAPPRFAWLYGALAGVAYIYLVSAWGAYIFVLNMIGVHVGVVMLLMGRFSWRMYWAFTLFYVIGTAGALQFPVVGWQPLQSLEQIGPLAVFALAQIVALAEAFVWCTEKGPEDAFAVRILFLTLAALGGACAVQAIVPAGFFGPLSARVSGLFVRHTKTGNPLVDSVAEHQATPTRVYWLYFHVCMYLTPVGFYLLWRQVTRKDKDAAATEDSGGVDGVDGDDAGDDAAALTSSRIFVLLLTGISFYFSSRMIRLVLLFSPAAAISSGIAGARYAGWAIKTALTADATATPAAAAAALRRRHPPPHTRANRKSSAAPSDDIMKIVQQELDNNPEMRQGAALMSLVVCFLGGFAFLNHSLQMAPYLSEPQVIVRIPEKSPLDGSSGGSVDSAGRPKKIIADDFREAYWWLRDNTPKNSRVLAWWDYGYQLAGIAERTTLADGNTWNHEHIALVGLCFVKPEEESHAIVRHLADYVYIWTTRHAGLYGDDLAKSPHMARIAGSVFSDVNASRFRFVDTDGTPSEDMEASMLYSLHSHGFEPDVAEPQFYEEVFTSKNSMARIYKVKDVSEESRQYGDTHHAYPPALDGVLARVRNFGGE